MSLVFENTNVACTVIFKEKKGPGYKTVRVNEVYILTLSTTRRECADRLRAVVPGDGPEAGFLASSWCLSNFLTVNINCFYRQNSNNKPQYREVMSRSLWFRPRQRAEGRLAQAAPYPQGAGPGRLLGSSGMVRSVLWPSGWGGGGRAHLLPLAWGSDPVLSHPPVPKVAEVLPAADLAPGALVLAHIHQGAGLPACRELGQVEGHGNRPQ